MTSDSPANSRIHSRGCSSASGRPWCHFSHTPTVSSMGVIRATVAAGYEAAFAIDGGWVPARIENRFAIPRVNIPAGISANGFALLSAGLRV